LFPFFLLFVSLLLRICNIIFILLYFYNLILYETVCYNLCCCCCFYFSEGFFIRFDMAQVFWLLLPYPFRNIRTDEKFNVKFYLSKKNFSFWGRSKTFYESLKFFKWCWFIYWHMAEFYDYFIILLLLFLLPLLLFWRLVEKLKLYFRPKAINWEKNRCWFLFSWVKGFWSKNSIMGISIWHFLGWCYEYFMDEVNFLTKFRIWRSSCLFFENFVVESGIQLRKFSIFWSFLRIQVFSCVFSKISSYNILTSF